MMWFSELDKVIRYTKSLLCSIVTLAGYTIQRVI